MTHSGWQFKCTGWPWWVVLPLAILGVWSLVRLHQRELAALMPAARRRLLILRGAALGLVILFFLEPTFSRTASDRLLPAVAVIVDQSGSMAVRDEMMPEPARIAEAVGLGLVPSSAILARTNSDPAIAAPARAALTNALAAMKGLARYERAVRLAREKVLPALNDKARVSVFGLDSRLQPLDLADQYVLLPNRTTDFEAALGELARSSGQDYLGGVLLLSDGRQSAGLDPAPVIRGLRARGATFSGVLVGDPGEPPDAVVADLSGPGEVFLGENTPLTARYKITGSGNMEWDLVVTENGRELARRAVRETGGWDYENFVFPATNAGVNVYRARLEPARDPAANRLMDLTGNATLEIWNNANGGHIADFFGTPAADKPPSSTASIQSLRYSGHGEQYAARVRGFLIPPQTGDYVFWIASDDASELWVSPSADPAKKAKMAYVTDFVPEGHWNDRPTQRSQAITLQASHPCYFEILHKQGSGEAHLAAGWTLPDGTMERPIRSQHLTRFDDQSVRKLRERREALASAIANSWKEASLANNAADASVTVNEDSLKVLLVDSTPRWESRYLSAMFERDKRVLLTRRYHSIIVDDPQLSLLPKSQAEWDAYDMVCLGDLDPHELPPAQQRFVANFVARRGGFLVCLAGPRGLPQGFSLGPLSDLLPVRVGAPLNRDQEPVRVALTRQGIDHPITQVLDDPANNEKLWPLLPPLQWIADSVVAKPGSTVLLAARTPAKTPIVAYQRYGAGRVFWIGTEETWRWRDRLGDRVHQSFWLQAMRWGLAGRLRGKDPRLQVGLDRSLMNLGEQAELKARTSSADGSKAGSPPSIKLEQLDERGQVVTNLSDRVAWAPVDESPGLWRLSLENLAEGRWRVTVGHADPGLRQVVETREFLVRGRNSVEGLELGGDLPALNRMAAAGGGMAGTMDQTDGILRDLAAKLKPRWQDRRETIRLWNSYYTMLLVMALLCVEWTLRKRHGLP
jgi:hypothetical protein